MIVVFSEVNDLVTNKVIEWLIHLRKDFVRINSISEIQPGVIFLSNRKNSFTFSVFKKEISYEDITTVWFRKIRPELLYESEIKTLEDKVLFHKETEELLIREYVVYLLSKKAITNTVASFNLNKLIMLSKAAIHGVQIPPTVVTNSNTYLRKFGELNKKVINKTIGNIFNYYDPETNVAYHSQTIPVSFRKKQKFSHSLFQKHCGGDTEIRLYYFKGHYFALAISGNYSSDKRFSDLNNNFFFEFRIPDEYKIKLESLLSDLKILECCIDIILTTDNALTLLDINPCGQFDFVSYYLEKDIPKFIAEKLV
jgi:hypothetical protein